MKWFIKEVGKKLLVLIGALSLALALIRLFPINYTASMPFGLYMRIPAGNIKEGDLVEVDNPLDSSGWGVYNRHGLLKRVDHINPDGTYYVLGEDEYSYDSRYFGAVGREYIKSRLIPLWTTYNLPEWLRQEEEIVYVENY